MTLRRTLLAATALAGMLAGPARPQQPAADPGPNAINTGGINGAYHSAFCPQIPPVLAAADFRTYACARSAGSAENIARVLVQPKNVSFVQFDVLARHLAQNPNDTAKVAIIRDDLACEGLWMVTRNPTASFGDIQGRARRLKFILPPSGSGSSASFDFLRSIDPDGLGRARDENVERVASALDVVNRIANSPPTESEVGFFVQFADPDNAVIKRIVEAGLTVVPVVSRAILRAAVGEVRVYEAQTFDLAAGGFLGIGGRGIKVTTACTKVVLVTGAPAAFEGRDDQEDARDRALALANASRAKLLPTSGGLAAMLRGATRLSQAAVDGITDTADRARRAVVE